MVVNPLSLDGLARVLSLPPRLMFHLRRQFSLVHRLTALLGIALVLLLSVLAASPEAHEFLHHGGSLAEQQAPADSQPAHDDDDGCAVVMFAHGHVLAAMVLLLLLLVGLVCLTTFDVEQALPLAAVDFELPPGCGPPVA